MYFFSVQFIWLLLEKYNVEQVTTVYLSKKKELTTVSWANGFNYNNRKHTYSSFYYYICRVYVSTFNFIIILDFCRCSTIGAIIMTPLLTKLLAGQLVPVDGVVSWM